MSPVASGTAFSLGAALFAAAFLIPFKQAGLSAQREVVVLAMLATAAVANTIATLIQARGRLRIHRRTWIVAVVLAGCTILGNIGVVASLARVEPAITSVIIQTQVILVALMELAFLRERLSRWLIGGCLLAVAGFLVMQAPWAAATAGDVPGMLWALLAAVTFGIMLVVLAVIFRRVRWVVIPLVTCSATVLVMLGLLGALDWRMTAATTFGIMLVVLRHSIAHVDPLAVNALRLWLAVALLACWPGAAAGALAMDATTWLLAAAAGLAGPTVSRLMLMAAVRRFSATQTKLTTLVSPLCALGLGLLAFGTMPTARELLGGTVILLGVAMPLLPHLRRNRDGTGGSGEE